MGRWVGGGLGGWGGELGGVLLRHDIHEHVCQEYTDAHSTCLLVCADL